MVFISEAKSSATYQDGSLIDVKILCSHLHLEPKLIRTSFQVCSSVSSAADQAYDYVVVTTKAIPDVTRTSSLLSALLSAPYTEKYSQPTYVLLQNGLNVEADLYQALEDLGKGDPKIISTAVYIGTNLLAPDVVEHNLTVASSTFSVAICAYLT